MPTYVRVLRERVVAVGALALLAMLASAVPADAASDWTFYQKYTSTGSCREHGEDLLFSRRVIAFRCIPYVNSRRVDLQVRYANRPE